MTARPSASSTTRSAARFLGSLSLEEPLTTTLLGVVERPVAPRNGRGRLSGPARAAVDQLIAERRHELEAALASIQIELKASMVASAIIGVGRPAHEILKAARHAGLIVVGARGLGSVERLLLGSVSEQVLHRASCPVLVVRDHLLNLAAIHALLNRGTVYAVPPTEMPVPTPVAAVLRY